MTPVNCLVKSSTCCAADVLAREINVFVIAA